MKNPFLIPIAISAVLAASCTKEATSSKQTTNLESQNTTSEVQQTAAKNYKTDSGSQAQNSVFRNSRKRLPSR